MPIHRYEKIHHSQRFLVANTVAHQTCSKLPCERRKLELVISAWSSWSCHCHWRKNEPCLLDLTASPLFHPRLTQCYSSVNSVAFDWWMCPKGLFLFGMYFLFKHATNQFNHTNGKKDINFIIPLTDFSKLFWMVVLFIVQFNLVLSLVLFIESFCAAMF